MAKEIERKFLVTDLSVLDGCKGFSIVQGYLAKDALSVRVRTFGNKAFLTLKGPTAGLSRDEFEYQIPLEDALAMLECYCNSRLIRKKRYLIPHLDHVFEVDVFEGKLAGLVVAEVELDHEDQVVDLPPWIGMEVTGDTRFGNYSLAQMDGPPDACFYCLAPAGGSDCSGNSELTTAP